MVNKQIIIFLSLNERLPSFQELNLFLSQNYSFCQKIQTWLIKVYIILYEKKFLPWNSGKKHNHRMAYIRRDFKYHLVLLDLIYACPESISVLSSSAVFLTMKKYKVLPGHSMNDLIWIALNVMEFLYN